jgi:diketogulonate reductase-like aldo/keto reductase
MLHKRIHVCKMNARRNAIMEFVTLNNGVRMPMLGYGVFQVTNEECVRCVLDAMAVGYRLIDTAQAYGNEEGVGNAIVKCGIPREEIHHKQGVDQPRRL